MTSTDPVTVRHAAERREEAARTRVQAVPPGLGRAGGGWLRWAWRQLTSMRTALILLFLLAIASVPGSVLPQEGIDPAAVSQYYDGPSRRWPRC